MKNLVSVLLYHVCGAASFEFSLVTLKLMKFLCGLLYDKVIDVVHNVYFDQIVLCIM